MYKTTDLYLAAFLRANEHKIRTTKREKSKVTFFFDDTDILRNKVLDFFNDGLVSVTKFKNAINDLKTIIYNVGV